MNKDMQSKSMYVEVTVVNKEIGAEINYTDEWVDEFEITGILDVEPKLYAFEIDDFINIDAVYKGYPILIYVDEDNGKYYALQGRLDICNSK